MGLLEALKGGLGITGFGLHGGENQPIRAGFGRIGRRLLGKLMGISEDNLSVCGRACALLQ